MLILPASIIPNLITFGKSAQLIDIVGLEETLRITGSIPAMPEKITNKSAHRQLLSATRPMSIADRVEMMKTPARMDR